MSFPRCNGDNVQVIAAAEVQSLRPEWPRARSCASTWTIVLIALVAGEAFGQGVSNSRQQSPDPATKDIPKYLVSREADPDGSKAKGPPMLSVDEIVQKVMAANARRSAELRGFQGKRKYDLQYHGLLGGREASMEVLATYSAPDQRTFSVVSQSGSKLLLNRVLLKLLDSEKEAFEHRKQVELSPENYKFELVGADSTADGNSCFVLVVKPRKPNKFLYAGKIWVDAHDFAVVRMEGEPAKSPSFWIRDTQIDCTWEKVGNFWFIAHNRSVSHIRMGGAATLTIDYDDYQITGVDRRAAKSQAQGPILPEPASVTPQR
ncbi:MAG: hypothetical protein JWN74_3698 [Acidobacteriaceae bacterium]|nr:hypothetical protein [Acidobacteriaceae bacterium]